MDAITNIAMVKARPHYGENNINDVEAAMLINHCKAVKEYRAKLEKRKEKKKFNDGIESSLGINKSRESIYKDSFKSTLADRDKT